MDEYIIINKTAIQKRIEELEKERQEHEKVPIGTFDSIWAAKTSQAIDLLREILSQSTPLIPEIEKAFKEGYRTLNNTSFDSKGYNGVEKNYISNLKLNI